MSNLGPYQDIVVLAKSVGGVETLIEKIGKEAVARATPGRMLIGAACGVVITVAGFGTKRLWDARAVRIAEGELAGQQLRDLVDGAVEQNDELAREESVADDEGL